MEKETYRLLGIILPSYPRNNLSSYNPYTIPPRLYDNIKCNFAQIYNWNDNPFVVQMSQTLKNENGH